MEYVSVHSLRFERDSASGNASISTVLVYESFKFNGNFCTLGAKRVSHLPYPKFPH